VPLGRQTKFERDRGLTRITEGKKIKQFEQEQENPLSSLSLRQPPQTLIEFEPPSLLRRRLPLSPPMAWCDLRRDFSHFVVVDFEATCEKDIYLQEIIEFPAVLVDVATGYLLSAFRDTTRASPHFARS
jgi:hypothetical protein